MVSATTFRRTHHAVGRQLPQRDYRRPSDGKQTYVPRKHNDNHQHLQQTLESGENINAAGKIGGNTPQVTSANRHSLTVPGGLITWSQPWVHAPCLKKEKPDISPSWWRRATRPSRCLSSLSLVPTSRKVKVTARRENRERIKYLNQLLVLCVAVRCGTPSFNIWTIFGGKTPPRSCVHSSATVLRPKTLPAVLKEEQTFGKVKHRREFHWANRAQIHCASFFTYQMKEGSNSKKCWSKIAVPIILWDIT